MFKIILFSIISFFVSIANAGFQIQGSYPVVSAGYCDQYQDLKSAEISAQSTYEIVLSRYNKQTEGSEKQKEYKIRLDKALAFLNSIQENISIYKQQEFAIYKIILDSDYKISKLDLINEEGSLDFDYTIEHMDIITVSAGSLVVRFLGADLCGSSASTSSSESSIAEKFLSKIFK